MKEWALKHPVMTFLLADAIIAGTLKVVAFGLSVFGKTPAVTQTATDTEEESKDESSDDIQ